MRSIALAAAASLTLASASTLLSSSLSSDLDSRSLPLSLPARHKRSPQVPKKPAKVRKTVDAPAASGPWTLQQAGNTGVAAMQMSVVGDHHVIIIDKVEKNPLQVNGHSAWGALYDLNTQKVMPLDMVTNSFCAGGTFLSNGTFINLGGTAIEANHTVPTKDGLQAVRFFEPSCLSNPTSCKIQEYPGKVGLAASRWYPSSARIEDGSAIIVGGSNNASFINSKKLNVPSLEYYPPKTFSFSPSPGAPIPMDFLKTTLAANLFPFLITLPTPGQVLIIANTQAIIYNWKSNKVTKLPNIPNGVRVTYPMTASGTLLPLSPSNNYEPEVLICGGSTIDDKKRGREMDSQTPASSQCARLVVSSSGIKKGWKAEKMPFARIMPDVVLMPNGKVMIVNGAKSGVAGYGNTKNKVGASNADNPAFQPVMYDPNASSGSRFSTVGLPVTNIARLYHSVALLTPQGKIMIAGSNPNGDVSSKKYATEYRVEYYSPPWISTSRPSISNTPSILAFGQTFNLKVGGVKTTDTISVNIMDYGFITHSVHMNSRLVELKFKVVSDTEIQITIPPNGSVFPPGVAWLHVIVNGIPSIGQKLLIGNGDSPPVDIKAIRGVQGLAKK